MSPSELVQQLQEQRVAHLKAILEAIRKASEKAPLSEAPTESV